MNTRFTPGRWAPAVLLLCATWLSPSAMAQADEARAKKIVGGSCFVCHGAEGESSSEVFPRLAGQHWEYTAKQLENFKSGKRKSTAMADMVAKLTPDEMAALGKFFEKQKAEAEPIAVEKGEPLRLECQHFLDSIVNNCAPRTDGAEGLRVLKVLDAASRALKGTGAAHG